MNDRRLFKVNMSTSVLETYGYDVARVMMADFAILEAHYELARDNIAYTVWYPAIDILGPGAEPMQSWWCFTETIKGSNERTLTGSLIFGKESISKTITFSRSMKVEGKNSYQEEEFSV